MTTTAWLVVFASEAVTEFEEVKSRGERKATFNAIAKLMALGPDLPPPHMKSLKDAPGLCELRPRHGNSPVRPIYARCGSKFVVLSVAKDKPELDGALARAQQRLPRYAE